MRDDVSIFAQAGASAAVDLPDDLIMFVKIGGLTAMIGGGLRIITAFMTSPPESLPHELLWLLIDIELMAGLLALFFVARRRLGWLGNTSLAVAFLGLASILGPDTVAFGVDTYYLGAAIMGVSVALLGIAGLRTGLAPRWAYAAWVAVPVLSLAGDLAGRGDLGFQAAGIAFGVGFLGVGKVLVNYG